MTGTEINLTRGAPDWMRQALEATEISNRNRNMGLIVGPNYQGTQFTCATNSAPANYVSALSLGLQGGSNVGALTNAVHKGE